MKINWGIIKLLVLTALVVFLFGFAKKRNEARNLSEVNIEFLDDSDPFITLSTVNKLLIQNHDTVTSIPKETLVLKEMEKRLLDNDMIRIAEVYVTVDGVLGAKIEQRQPIGRVAATPNYYLDADGKKMPLSSVYTTRVPLITGLSKNNFTELTSLLLKIKDDQFMKTSVIGVNVSENGQVSMQVRKHDFEILFGKPKSIDKKFKNFKAFYKKTQQDSTLASYKTVELQFGNQVVATKKEGYGT